MTIPVNVVEAVKGLDPDVWYDIGPHLTCHEAHHIGALLRAIGAADAADTLFKGHAEGDTE